MIARAQTEKDAELSAALLELIGKQKLVAGVEVCRAGVAGIPVRAKAARECLKALGEPAPKLDLQSYYACNAGSPSTAWRTSSCSSTKSS